MNELKIQKDILTSLSKNKFIIWAETLYSICASDNEVLVGIIMPVVIGGQK